MYIYIYLVYHLSKNIKFSEEEKSKRKYSLQIVSNISKHQKFNKYLIKYKDVCQYKVNLVDDLIADYVAEILSNIYSGIFNYK